MVGYAGFLQVADAVPTTCEVAAELVAANRQARAAGLLAEAEQAAAACVDRPELRVRAALDLADALRTLGELTGRGEVAEETLEHIFANFCVGK